MGGGEGGGASQDTAALHLVIDVLNDSNGSANGLISNNIHTYMLM